MARAAFTRGQEASRLKVDLGKANDERKKLRRLLDQAINDKRKVRYRVVPSSDGNSWRLGGVTGWYGVPSFAMAVLTWEYKKASCPLPHTYTWAELCTFMLADDLERDPGNPQSGVHAVKVPCTSECRPWVAPYKVPAQCIVELSER